MNAHLVVMLSLGMAMIGLAAPAESVGGECNGALADANCTEENGENCTLWSPKASAVLQLSSSCLVG